MTKLSKILKRMSENPKGVRYIDLRRVCEHYFGEPRRSSGSHCVFKTPWPADHRVNIQNSRGKAKPYQVRQVLNAIEKLKANNEL